MVQFLVLTFVAALFYSGGYNYFGYYFSGLGAVTAKNGQAFRVHYGSGEDIPGPLRDRLIVNYPDEMKKLIVEEHNLYRALEVAFSTRRNS